MRRLAGNLSKIRRSGIWRLCRALEVVEESVSIGEWKEDRAMVLGSVRRHCEWVVGQLIVAGGVGVDGEGVRASPLLATDDWTQSPDCV